MSDETARLALPQLVSLQELNAVTWNEALEQLDAVVDLCILGQFVNTPPATPHDGDAYLIGGAPTGAWSGYAYKIASCRDGAWRFYTPFNGLRAFVMVSNSIIIHLNGTWTAIGSTDFATKSGVETLTNKTLASATLSGSTALPGGGGLNSSGHLGIGGSAQINGHLLTLEGTQNNSVDFWTGNYDSTHSNASAGSSFVAGSTIAEVRVTNQVYSGDYSTPNAFIFINRNGPIVLRTGGFTSAQTRLTIDVNGNLFPGATNAQNLGSSSYCWANGYIQNAWTVVSDETLKDEIAGLSEAETAVAKEIAPLVALYKMKSAIAEKGSGARTHCGWIAQRIERAFAAHGLDPFAYGCVGFDLATRTETRMRTVLRPKMDEAGAVLDADGHAVLEELEEAYQEQVPDRDQNGEQKKIHNIRSEEVTAFALAGLAARIAALEAAREQDDGN